jgi:hypothetical protein
MNTRNTLLALSTALTLGLLGTSLAQADADHGGSGEGRAFHVGPTGQILGNSTLWDPDFDNGRSAPASGSAYGYAPHHPAHKHHRVR